MYGSLTLWLGTLTGATVTAMLSNDFINDLPERALPFRSWLPYSYPSLTLFLLGYVWIFFIHAIMASAGSTTDTLIAGLMMQTSAQLEILKYRLRNIPNVIDAASSISRSDKNDFDTASSTNIKLAECVRHHGDILRSVKESLKKMYYHWILNYIILVHQIRLIFKSRFYLRDFSSIHNKLNCLVLQRSRTNKMPSKQFWVCLHDSLSGYYDGTNIFILLVR